MKNIISSERRDNWLEMLWEWKGEKRNLIKRYKMLNNSQIEELANSELITIGAHTLSHSAIKNRSMKERKIEIEESIMKLKDISGTNIELFSYPFGVYGKDYDEKDNELCKIVGIRKTFSTNFGAWNEIDGDMNIKRNGVNNKNLYSFKNYYSRIVDS